MQVEIKRKQKNRNMKTRISQLAAITLFSLILLVGNVNAKGTEKNASSHENIEASLELENWMVNDNLWDINNTFKFENANEESLELESWMTNDEIWKMENTFETEKEQTLAIEPWMTDENIWNQYLKELENAISFIRFLGGCNLL